MCVHVNSNPNNEAETTRRCTSARSANSAFRVNKSAAKSTVDSPFDRGEVDLVTQSIPTRANCLLGFAVPSCCLRVLLVCYLLHTVRGRVRS